MAKKRPAKKTAPTTKKTETNEDEQIALSPAQDKALKMVDKSAKVRAELEEAVSLAITKAVRKCMKDNKIELTLPEVSVLASIWFGEDCEED
jgi:hypothetical protein